MSSSVNEVRLLGNLGADPELRYTGGGKAVCNLRLATSFKPKNGPEQTEWHRVVVWNETAENCAKFLTKGRQVYVEGRLTTKAYTTKDGQTRQSTEIAAARVLFIGGGGSSQARLPANDNPRAARAAAGGDDGPPPDDDYPGGPDDKMPF